MAMNLRLPDPLADRMRRFAARHGTSQQELARQAIADYLDAHEAQELARIPAPIRHLVTLPERPFSTTLPNERIPLPDDLTFDDLLAWGKGRR